jgi:MraZ protein
LVRLKGTYTNTVDKKGRISVPAKFRRALETDGDETFVLTRGLDPCLLLYSHEEWRKVEAWLDSLPVGRRSSRDLVRLFTAYAHDVAFDKQGRITIPPVLKEYGKLEKEVLVIGVLDRLELWNPSLFRKQVDAVEESEIFDEGRAPKEFPV